MATALPARAPGHISARRSAIIRLGVAGLALREIRAGIARRPRVASLGGFGPSIDAGRVLWVDYDSSVSMHPTATGVRRVERLLPPSPDDNITHGCINVSPGFTSRSSVPRSNTAGVHIRRTRPRSPRLSRSSRRPRGATQGRKTRATRPPLKGASRLPWRIRSGVAPDPGPSRHRALPHFPPSPPANILAPLAAAVRWCSRFQIGRDAHLRSPHGGRGRPRRDGGFSGDHDRDVADIEPAVRVRDVDAQFRRDLGEAIRARSPRTWRVFEQVVFTATTSRPW